MTAAPAVKRREAAWITALTALLLAVLVLLLPGRAYLPQDLLIVDMVSAFAPQWLGFCATCAVACAWHDRWLRAGAFALLLVPDFGTALFVGAADADAREQPLGALYAANLSARPRAVRRAVAELSRIDPDLVWLSEFPESLDAETEAAFQALEDRYPFGIAWPASAGRGLRFLSRYPVRTREEFNPERAPGRPGLRLTLDVNGRALTVFALHTHPPTQDWSLKARNQALDWVAEELAGTGGDAVVVGDLNTSAFSPRFLAFVRRAGLDCASPWRCAVGSWPAPLRPLLTPIDHVLARGRVRVASLERGGHTGSDHYPVVAQLVYRPPG
ncbi:MAG: endonuclease/exonuclease/phosphatase family protein [Pseudomonadales bacterium]|jgi:endonuclease/exonuclease/phosphatase (EEP) superfamily protein YafD|nr:endonuclease/exonuclease/phosphatase family protein [Pseudomonadales bacterium]